MRAAFALSLTACCLTLAPVAPARADEEERKIKEELERAGKAAAAGRRIRELSDELKGSKLWVQQAVLLVELADLQDRRAVAPLAEALRSKHPHVVAFALHGLDRQPAEDLRKGGGAALAEALVDALELKVPYHRRAAHGLLVKVVGEDLGGKPSKWKRWLKKNGDALKVELEDRTFDGSGYDPEKVKRVVTGMDEGGGTQVVERLPNVTESITTMMEGGLDLALCLDETSSMDAVIQETKAKMELLVSVIAQVVPDYQVGLVTYNDAVKTNEGLSRNLGGLLETLSAVKAEGGGDIPEGVDKALDVALEPRFGWRRKSAKCVVVLGDAPPHPEDVDACVKRVTDARAQAQIRVNLVSTGPSPMPLPDFDKIAEAGGGRSLKLAEPNALVGEVLLIVFGDDLRPAMERFVPVLLEVLGEQAKGR